MPTKSVCSWIKFEHAHNQPLRIIFRCLLRSWCSVINCAHVRMDYVRARIQSTMMHPGPETEALILIDSCSKHFCTAGDMLVFGVQEDSLIFIALMPNTTWLRYHQYEIYLVYKFEVRILTGIAVTVETCACICTHCKSLFMRHSSSGWLISNISLFQTRVLWQTIHLFMSGCYQAVDRPMLVQEKRHRATSRWMFYVKWAMAEQSGCLSERLAHCKVMGHHMLGNMRGRSRYANT